MQYQPPPPPPVTVPPVSKMAIGLLVAAVLAFFTTFLPMGPTSIGRYTRAAGNVMEGNFEGLGSLVVVQVIGFITAVTASTILRLLLVATIIAAILAIALRNRLTHKIAGISGVITGILGVLTAVTALVITSFLNNAPYGVGTMVLLMFCFVVTVIAWFARRPPKTAAAPEYGVR